MSSNTLIVLGIFVEAICDPLTVVLVRLRPVLLTLGGAVKDGYLYCYLFPTPKARLIVSW